MRVHWFGEPWGNTYRAPICEDDAFRVEIPLGHECIDCGKQFKKTSQGVITGCSPSIWGHWMLEIEGVERPVCAYHLHCWLAEVVGGEMSHRILERMHKQGVADDFTPPVPKEGPVEPGRGWHHAEGVVDDD
jgi:hypothetical protein